MQRKIFIATALVFLCFLVTILPSMTEEVTEDYIKPEMVLIEGGTIQMGSESGDDREKPVHSVTVDSLYMSKYEVTNKEYKLFNPDHKGYWSASDYPVETVSWYDAVEYCNWLSDREGIERCYSGSGKDITCDFTKNGYRLPTEAEWEYACRAGTTTEYYWGDEMDGNYCWYCDNSGGQVNKVGQKKPNSFGLYDMSGNVWEWCWDWYAGSYYSNSPSSNPIGPSTGSTRVNRGGGWCYRAVDCRSAYRFDIWPLLSQDYLGFRPVRSVP